MASTDIVRDLGIGRTTLHRYEGGEDAPASVLLYFSRLALERNAPAALTRPLLKEYAAAASLSGFAAVLAILLTLEGPDAAKHLTRLAKRAAELVG